MSPVTRKSEWLGSQDKIILSSIHMENFSPVIGMKSDDSISQA